ASVHEVAQLLPGALRLRRAGVDAQLVRAEVVGEGHQLAVPGGEGVVLAVALAADAVVLVPGSPAGGPDLVGPAGDRIGRAGGDAVAVGVLHPGGEAAGHAVLGAAERRVEGSGQGDQRELAAVLHHMGDRVVPEGERSALVGVGDVAATGHAAGAVVLVPAAADGDLVRVLPGGQIEAAGVDPGGRVGRELGGLAVRLPVARAAHRRVVRAGHGHGVRT